MSKYLKFQTYFEITTVMSLALNVVFCWVCLFDYCKVSAIFFLPYFRIFQFAIFGLFEIFFAVLAVSEIGFLISQWKFCILIVSFSPSKWFLSSYKYFLNLRVTIVTIFLTVLWNRPRNRVKHCWVKKSEYLVVGIKSLKFLLLME